MRVSLSGAKLDNGLGDWNVKCRVIILMYVHLHVCVLMACIFPLEINYS